MKYLMTAICLLALGGTAKAMEIEVDGRKEPISVDDMRAVELKSTRRIEQAFYNVASGYLVYRNRGRAEFFERCAVPGNIVSEWEETGATTQYFMRNILNHYGCG